MDYTASITEAANASDSENASTYATAQSEAGNAQDAARAGLCAPFTPTVFRLQFPVFQSTLAYPETQVSFYIKLGFKLLSAGRWGDILNEGIALFTAHFLALDKLAQSGAGGSGAPGTAVGIVNSGSVDKVSYGKDIASVMEENAGHWGMTTFGLQFLRFARMMGAGPIQVGVGDVPFYGQSAFLYANGAWPGVQNGFW